MTNLIFKFLIIVCTSAYSLSTLACISWTAYVDADVVAARNENGCVITVRINYVKKPQACSIDLKVGTHVEIYAPEDLMSSGCPVDGGLFMEGDVTSVNGRLILTSGEVW